jgi:integrase
VTPFRQKGRKVYSIKVPQPNGVWVTVTTGTRDRVTAKAMQDAVRALGPEGKRAFDLLAGALSKKGLAAFWASWQSVPVRTSQATGKPLEPSIDERIEYMRTERDATNIVPLVETWHTVLTGPSRAIGDDTAAHYRSAVRELVAWLADVDTWKALPKGAVVLASELTETKLRTYIEELDDVSASTVRKKGQGIRDFTGWLVGRGKLAIDPMRNVELPPQGKPLAHYVDTHEAKALADAQPGPYRLFSALLAGTGIEVSVALALRRRNVETKTKEIRAAGTKTYNRDRIVRVADWAWPYVLEAIDGKHTDALLFDEIGDRWLAQDEHNDAVAALVAKGFRVFAFDEMGREKRYTMRDQRHTWAVRAARSGWPVEGIGRQLGHVNGVLALSVYGRFCPTSAERDKWEALATARDEAKEKEREGKR